MQNRWTKEELEVYVKYCKLNNIRYECIWIDLEDEEREKTPDILHKQMLKIDKPVKVYLDFEYIKTIRYSLLDFVKEELPNKLLTWIPANFESKQQMALFLDRYLENEIQAN